MPRFFRTQHGTPGEYRLGPFVFVTGLGSSPYDPWAHRRGEPRVFALCWTLFLIAATFFTVFAARTIGGSMLTQHRFATLALCQTVAVGITLLWPAFRLSQARAPRPLSCAAVDTLIVVLPLIPLSIPLPWLTHWPIWPVAALAGTLSAWAVLTGAVLAIAGRANAPSDRTASMALWTAYLLAVPLVAGLIWSVTGVPFAWDTLGGVSPFIGIGVLMNATPEHAPDPSLHQFVVSVAPPLAIAALVWAFVLAQSALGGGSQPRAARDRADRS